MIIWKRCEYKDCFVCNKPTLHDVYDVNGILIKLCRQHKSAISIGEEDAIQLQRNAVFVRQVR